MSLLLSSYLGDLLAASPCKEIIFRHDNCPSSKDYRYNHVVAPFALETEEDVPSVASSLPELSRWDSSSSSSTSSMTSTCASTKNKTVSEGIIPRGEGRTQKSLQPPRRQLSWEDRVFCPNDSMSSSGDDEVSGSHKPSHESVPCPPAAAPWDVQVLQQGEAQQTSNLPPRPPARRISSRFNSFPPAEPGPPSTLWHPGDSSRNTSVSVPGADQLLHKIPIPSSDRKQSSCDYLESKIGIPSTNDKKKSDGAAPQDVYPPRPPRRQRTPEIMNKKGANSPTRSDEVLLPKSKENGDSLYGLLKLKRISNA
jgi:hypothetical protein